jgi:hypothetical protein
MTFTVIDAPAPAGLISISAAAVPFMALISTVPPDLAVFSACQPPDGSAFCSTGFRDGGVAWRAGPPHQVRGLSGGPSGRSPAPVRVRLAIHGCVSYIYKSA